MEGELNEPEAVPAAEQESRPFLRVEFDEEHKIFVKECDECGNIFKVSVPRKFFLNPNDESIKLRVTGRGAIDGYSEIPGEAVMNGILKTTCADTARNEKALKEKSE